MSWKIWYSDKSTFSSTDGNPFNAPKKGVEVITEKRDGRTLLHSKGEVYGWDGIGWNTKSSVDKNWLITLYGELMDTKEFKALREEAMLWLHPEV